MTTNPYQQTANAFNIGDTTNVSQNALAQAIPMMSASNNYQNALQQLALARIGQQQGLAQTGMNIRAQQVGNQLYAMQPNDLSYLGLGLSGINALKGGQQNQYAQNYGYTPNWSLPVPQPTGGQ